MFSERPAGLHRCSFHGHEIWEQMRQNMKAEKAKSQQLLVSLVNYTHLSGWSICVKLKWAAWDQCCTEKSEADVAEIQCSHATRSRTRKRKPFVCGVPPFGTKMGVFVLAWTTWTFTGGSVRSGPNQVESQRSLSGGASHPSSCEPPRQPPDASAIKRQGKGRRWLLRCRWVSGMPHMLKTLASVQLGLFLPSLKEPKRSRGCKGFVAWGCLQITKRQESDNL